jgi:hypothetical protein
VGLPARAAGTVLVGVGGTVITSAFVRFVREGLGTPMPTAPPSHLVVGGAYRYVRNPMYLALASTVLGQALILGSRRLLLYVAVMALRSIHTCGSMRSASSKGRSASCTSGTARTYRAGCPGCTRRTTQPHRVQVPETGVISNTGDR